MDEPESPDWLTEPCPAWCRRTHSPDDHPEDRRHQGAAEVILVRTSRGATPGLDVETSELVVHADRPVGDAETWIRIESTEEPDVRLAITQPSAQALLRALRATLLDLSQ